MKQNKVTPEIVKNVKDMLESGIPESEVRKLFREKTGLSKSQGNAVFNEVKAGISKSIDAGVGLEFVSAKYTYNRQDGVYIFDLKSRQKPLVLHESKVRSIARAYSDWGEGLTSNEICRKFSLTPDVFQELKNILKLSKDREPLTVEEVLENPVAKSVEEIIEEKRYKIYQGYEKQSWKETQDKAACWDRFNWATLDPLSNILSNWQPPKIKAANKVAPVKNAKASFVCCLSDNHLGELSKKENLFSGEDYNSSIASKVISEYADQIAETVYSRNYKFKDAYLVVTGDYLHSCFDGKTVKGTQLHSDLINEEMFELGLNVFIDFVCQLTSLFPEVNVKILAGNHDEVLLRCLGMAAAKYFENASNVNIEISKSWASLFKIGNVAVVATHGGSSRLKTAFPNSPTKLKTYIQDLILSRVDDLAGCKQKIVLSGHKHSFKQEDMGGFEFYCLGASVLGDSYADEMNLRSSNPRQNCLILDGDYVRETLHYYF